ncbi:MAG: FeoB-associated Cys-rich membrane protein [Oscillospiraceae bacterium]|nr:FeoB-associated Cys-rich membrane protein [Oscillospiraceae bacterium]
MTDIIIVAVLFVILGAAARYVIKAKKSGKKCIGCPDGGSCSGSCGSCGCGCGENKE